MISPHSDNLSTASITIAPTKHARRLSETLGAPKQNEAKPFGSWHRPLWFGAVSIDDIAFEQIVWWQHQRVSAQRALYFLTSKVNSKATWVDVFRLIRRGYRRRG